MIQSRYLSDLENRGWTMKKLELAIRVLLYVVLISCIVSLWSHGRKIADLDNRVTVLEVMHQDVNPTPDDKPVPEITPTPDVPEVTPTPDVPTVPEEKKDDGQKPVEKGE